MSDNDDILNSIKSSFQSALDIVETKKNIECEIRNIISLIKESTSDVVYAVIGNPDILKGSLPYYSEVFNYDNAVILKSNANKSTYYFLCVYSLNKSTGFPVLIRYKNEEFSCNTTDILKITLKNILTSPETAMAMANLFNGKEADY